MKGNLVGLLILGGVGYLGFWLGKKSCAGAR